MFPVIQGPTPAYQPPRQPRLLRGAWVPLTSVAWPWEMPHALHFSLLRRLRINTYRRNCPRPGNCITEDSGLLNTVKTSHFCDNETGKHGDLELKCALNSSRDSQLRVGTEAFRSHPQGFSYTDWMLVPLPPEATHPCVPL